MKKKNDLFSIRMRASDRDRHISGAEGIYSADKMQTVISGYMRRAIEHPRGRPCEINIKVEVLEDEPVNIPSLEVLTVSNYHREDSIDISRKILSSLGISDMAMDGALGIVYGKGTMRGAAVVTVGGFSRLEPDPERGVRVTCIGITAEALRELSGKLAVYKLDNHTVREAIILASKVANCDDIIAELCISDDPDYTTGYIASSYTGYVRIPHIKEKGRDAGGRVFFVKESSNVSALIHYLEKTPVMIDSVTAVKGEVGVSEFIGSHYS